jgi:DNA polymerase III epsilon subunit-like protein
MLITLDWESFYDSVCGFSSQTTEEYVRDPLFEEILVSIKTNNDPAYWFTGTRAEFGAHLRQFDWSQVVLAAHNCKFDGFILAHLYGIFPKRYICTMSMAKGLFGLASSVSLKAVAEYLQLSRRKGTEVENAYGKRRADFTTEQLNRYGSYSVDDTELCHEALMTMLPHIQQSEMQLIDWTIRAFCQPRLMLDKPVLQHELGAYYQRRGSLLQNAGIADVAVLRSDDTMARHLTALGIEPPMKYSPKQKNPDGSPKLVYAFSKQDVEFMDLLDSGDEQVVALVEARLGTKSSLLESRLTRLISIADRGPLPVPLQYCGATPTRRWSGDENINIQNFPRNKLKKDDAGNVVKDEKGKAVIEYSPLRQALIAPPGKRMAAADLSQIELRVNAWQSGQTDVLDILRNGGDVYSDQATALYGYTVTKESGKDIHAQERFVGKTTELQCGYQCGAKKFLHSLKVAARRDSIVLQDESLSFGERVVSGYRNKRHRIANFWYRAGEQLQNIAYGMQGQLGPYIVKDYKLWLPDGSYMYYPDLRYAEKQDPNEQGCEWTYSRVWKRAKVRKKIYGGLLVENITQHVARLFVSDALLRLDSLRYGNGQRVFDIVFSVHDELVVLYDEGLDEKWVKDALVWAMTTNPVWAPDLPLACEVGFGQNYAECK